MGWQRSRQIHAAKKNRNVIPNGKKSVFLALTNAVRLGGVLRVLGGLLQRVEDGLVVSLRHCNSPFFGLDLRKESLIYTDDLREKQTNLREKAVRVRDLSRQFKKV